ncbi:MAG: hypothetical protein KDC92_12455 [Bacteroidetes bacterium]|nr:hypothetical protein [Bacteroidota bacterium]
MQILLQVNTPNLEKSIAFYNQIGFQYKELYEKHFVSDGKNVIYINEAKTARAGIVFNGANMQLIDAITSKYAHTNANRETILADPSGTFIYLVQDEFQIPEFVNKNSLLGNAAGVSLEMVDVELGMKLYTNLGFSKTQGDLTNGWVLLQHFTGFGLSIMAPNACPHIFHNPSLTYFNGKEGNEIVIANLRESNISFAEEITAFNKEGKVDNVILTDPAGFGFFVFND